MRDHQQNSRFESPRAARVRRFGSCLLLSERGHGYALERMAQRFFQPLKVALLLACFSTCLGLSLFALTREARREIAHYPSPDGSYHLLLMQGERDWRGFPFSIGWRYFFYAGHESHNPTYGHHLDFELHPAMAGYFDDDLAAYARRAAVTWSDAGVSFDEPSGHRLFIPKAAYAGGR